MIRVVTEIIEGSGREPSADATLRRVLKARKSIDARTAREIAETVFAYYRWFGWLNPRDPIPKQVRQAQELDRNPPADLSRAVPDWIKDEVKVSSEWLRSLQEKPRLWIRARSGQSAALALKLGDCEPGPIQDALEYRGVKDLFSTAEFKTGEVEVQDIASQMVGLACSPKRGETWWDACAGEGGKLLHLSDLMQNKGLIWGSDRAQWRLDRLKRRAGRARVFNYRLVIWDGGARLPTKTKFDGILIDAPCSGTGTWGRNAQARWTLTRQDIAELKQLQIQLIQNARPALKPSGRLIYSVCTLARSETLDVVQAVESSLGQPQITWLWPQETRGNGMFIAVWTPNPGVH
ncbi:MAG TPA: RsmB/NOP family class I SAM-dependent RNA methyltransferase [Candidatus Binatia bacterium]|nr:RsmB/NOP family class I SAM-dependent RNA methyltransferase [Candidatus Binatia bacterium]